MATSSVKRRSAKILQSDVTVVLIVRDSERYVRDCLPTLISQRQVRWSVCIVSDKSTDSTLDIIRSVFNPDGQGVAYLSRKGALSSSRVFLDILKTLQTPYIAFMESFDRWTSPVTLSTQIKGLQHNRNVLISLCNAFEYDEATASYPLSFPEGLISQNSLTDALNAEYAPHLSSLVMRREAISLLEDIEVPTLLAACAWVRAFNSAQRLIVPSALSVHVRPLPEMSGSLPSITLLHEAYLKSIKTQTSQTP
ncbi:glycosyltransferase [Asticcacaulis currens]|uniref:glycosyltransferase n=1 Tax=Asticcacaulis currens TaxID=2984210 RepID=UPI0034A3DA1F